MIAKEPNPKSSDGAFERLKKRVDRGIGGVQGSEQPEDDLPQERGEAEEAEHKRDAGRGS
jgi:hypothetical protein